MMGIFTRGLVFLLLVLSWSVTGWAADVYAVSVETAVFARPKSGSKLLVRLPPGTIVQVERESVGVYKKVHFDFAGKSGTGYVLIQRLRGWRKQERARGEVRGFHQWIFSYVYSNYLQGKRELSTGPDSNYILGDFSGSASFFKIGYEFPFDATWSVRISGAQRSLVMEGDATIDGSPTVSVFDLSESLISAELGLAYSFMAPSNLVFIFGVEVAKSTDVQIDVKQGTAIDESGVEKPTFLLLSGALEYNYAFSKSWAVSPSLKIGAIANAEPFILVIDAGLGLKYLF